MSKDDNKRLSKEEKEAYNHLLLTSAKNGDFDNVKHNIKMGADVNAKDEDGKTALMLVAEQSVTATGDKAADLKTIAEHLLEKGADVNAKDKDGKTAKDIIKSHVNIMEGESKLSMLASGAKASKPNKGVYEEIKLQEKRNVRDKKHDDRIEKIQSKKANKANNEQAKKIAQDEKAEIKQDKDTTRLINAIVKASGENPKKTSEAKKIAIAFETRLVDKVKDIRNTIKLSTAEKVKAAFVGTDKVKTQKAAKQLVKPQNIR